MKELREILAASTRLRQAGIPAVLATVVKTRGSTYRKAGARMLLAADGTTVGVISGGCLENDLRERMPMLLASQSAELVTYDSTSPHDIIWGLGLGCAGTVDVLLEGTERSNVRDFFEFALAALDIREPFVTGTVYADERNAPAGLGSRWMMDRHRERSSGIPPGLLSSRLHDVCRDLLSSPQSGGACSTLSFEGGEACIEFVSPPLPLVVFGAGPDAVPVVRFARELGWDVTIADSRAALLHDARFNDVKRILMPDLSDLFSCLTFSGNEAALIMTHNFDLDFQVLRQLASTPIRYIGLLGSRQRTDLLLAALRAEISDPDAAELPALYSPVGLDIGAETPEEIALSAVAEIQSVFAGGTGGSLRDRSGAVHHALIHA